MPTQQRPPGNNKDKRQRSGKNTNGVVSAGSLTRLSPLPLLHHHNTTPAPTLAPSLAYKINIATPSGAPADRHAGSSQAFGSGSGAINPGTALRNPTAAYNRDKALITPRNATSSPPNPLAPPAKRTISPSVSHPLSRVMRLPQLIKDGRKPPQYFRNLMGRISTPSQISVDGISEKYNTGATSQFLTLEDVYRYRGYRKLGKIDEGAFGVVSKAQRIGDSLIVAVKEIDLSKKRAKRIEEMKRELFVLQKVEHKNIVQLIEHFVVDETLVIVMELCAGSNLSNLLKETPLSEEEALHLFIQMASSIKTLHRAGIAHRDIKLNNFLLDASRKHIKVADFGLSIVSWRPPAGLLMAKTYCGTEPYMAPEILRRNKHNMRSYNPMYADVWSLGICLFAMMTRTFPFKLDLTQRSLFRAQTARRWRFPRNVRDNCSEELNDLVWHMLDPEPERRITMNGIMSHPWLNPTTPYNFSLEEARPLLLTSSQPSPATRL